MKKSSPSMKLVAFDAARYLDSDEAVAEYMSACWRRMILTFCYLRSETLQEPRALTKQVLAARALGVKFAAQAV